MALTESNPFKNGTSAPDFNLLDTTTDKIKTLKKLKGNIGTVIMFICNHCPFVIHVNPELVRLAKDYQSKGINFIAISSNSIKSHPQDGPKFMKQLALEVGFSFPYLYDKTQEVAKAYKAACTPDFYIFDKNLKSVYHGQLDASRPGNRVPLSGEDIRAQLDSLIKGEENLADQTPSMGCGIKWL